MSSQMLVPHDSPHHPPHTTHHNSAHLSHIHPISHATPRNTSKHHATTTCLCADVPKRETVICSRLFFSHSKQTSQRKPFTSGLHFLGIPGNSLNEHKNRKHGLEKNADRFYLQTHNATKEFSLATRGSLLLHQPLSPAARLVSSQVGSKLKQRLHLTCCQLASCPSLPTRPAESSGRCLKLSFRPSLSLASLDNLMGLLPPYPFRVTNTSEDDDDDDADDKRGETSIYLTQTGESSLFKTVHGRSAGTPTGSLPGYSCLPLLLRSPTLTVLPFRSIDDTSSPLFRSGLETLSEQTSRNTNRSVSSTSLVGVSNPNTPGTCTTASLKPTIIHRSTFSESHAPRLLQYLA